MADKIDYKALGFLCGLEIHQRLQTDHKLFCRCASSIKEEGEHSSYVERKQRAVAGEMGNIDQSARFEEKKGRSFIYRISESDTCLVEVDEEPPGEINNEALIISLSIADAMRMEPLYEIEPMRKEVVDGSNPSAFQRTMLTGLNGHINVNGRRIGIPSISLEEESAGIIKAGEESAEYDTKRIGIPLVEIDTDQYIKDPEEAKEVALYIGRMLRITGKVQRGIGSIRQDVNVSIAEGSRVEIKGLQEVGSLDRFIENEVIRQVNLLRIKRLLEGQAAKVGEKKELSGIFKGTKSKMMTSSMKDGGQVYGFKLHGFGKALGTEVNPERRLGTEISDYAKMGGVKGIIHSDEELAKYGITEEEEKSVVAALGVGKEDAFILITGKKEAAEKGIEYARERATQAVLGVPAETRAVHDTKLFTTKFLRPIPGGARMYPETDVLPVLVTKELMKEAESASPNIERTLEAMKKELGSEDLANQMISSHRLALYKKLSNATKSDKRFIANTLLQKFVELSRNGYNVDSINEEELAEAFRHYEANKITKRAVEEVIKGLASGKRTKEVIKERQLSRKSKAEISKIIDSAIKKRPKARKDEIMSEIMSEYANVVDGQELKELVEEKCG